MLQFEFSNSDVSSYAVAAAGSLTRSPVFSHSLTRVLTGLLAVCVVALIGGAELNAVPADATVATELFAARIGALFSTVVHGAAPGTGK